MNLVADESVDAPSVSDEVVLHEAHARSALLMTADKDFGELVFRQHRATAGVVLLRLSGMPPHAKADHVASIMRKHASELVGAMSVIGPGSIRIRHQFG